MYLRERLAGWGFGPSGVPGPAVSAGTVVAGGRDARLDMFRGLALVMIFINHVPGTVYENFTNRNFGFSDAAEAFVFMSGMAAGLAYSAGFTRGALWPAIARIWARARTLYFVHIAITVLALGIFAGAAKWFGLYEVLTRNNIAPLFTQPLETMIGIPLLTHQLGYLNILPLYAVLLLVTPLLIPIGLRWPVPLALGSIVVWVLAGQFRINLPNYPNAGGWFFNPLSWQVVFVIGLLSGMAMKRGSRFVPYHPVLLALSAAFVVYVLVWMKVPAVGTAGREVLGQLRDWGVPFYLVSFDKSFLALPRLLHGLALFYLLGSLSIFRPIASSGPAAPLRLMGRQGLAVFAAGTVISLFLQAVKTAWAPDPLRDGLMLFSGLAALLALAWALTRTAEMTRAAAAARRAA